MQHFKILLLEAADGNEELITFELSKANMPVEVREVRNREAFLQALEEFRPNLILTDCRLPSFDGLMALALAQDLCPEVPFVFVADVLRAGRDEILQTGEAKFGPEFNGIMAHFDEDSLIVFLAPDRRILEFNHGAQRLTGWQRSEVLGRDAVELLVPKEKSSQVKTALSEIMVGEPARNLTLPLQRRDGSQQQFRLELSLLCGAQDQPLGILMVGHQLAAEPPHREPKPAQSRTRQTTPIMRRAIGYC